MIRIETTQLNNDYFESQAFVRGKLISTCRSLDKEYTIKEVNIYCELIKEKMQCRRLA